VTETPIIEEPENEPLEFVGQEIDDRGRNAKVCFAFRQPIDEADNLIIRDYIEVEPEFKFAQTVSGNDLCITGFNYAKDYEVLIKKGLPGIQGRKLKVDLRETISFGDKPQYVGFVGEGIILPRIGAQGLAVETVNVDRLKVEVSRVSDRMIARRAPAVGQTVQEGRYGYEGRNAATQIRVNIWDGQVDVDSVKNENVTTVLPLKEMVGELEPGAYIVSIKRDHEARERSVARAWRWVIVTDLAITAYRGENGANITVRSIDTAKLQSGIDVVLVAENNEIIATEKTDRVGHVFFPPALLEGKGPMRAKMVLAYGKQQDFALLDLNRASSALYGQDISGRYVEGDMDVYAFSERGVYRPGETVHFTIMMRDRLALAQSDRPLKLNVHRPNGVIIETKRITKEDINTGVVNWGYEIPSSAQRGNWRLSIKADGSNSSKAVGFAVEDFVPQKLRLAIKSDDKPIVPGEIRDVIVDAQFLYGAPGTALMAEAEARLRLDRFPFPDYGSYQFGPDNVQFQERFIEMGSAVTDGSGIAEFGFDYKNNPVKSVQPMRVEIVVGVAEPGGRFLKESSNIPVRSESTYVGISPNFKGSSLPSGEAASFKFVAVDPYGKPKNKNLSWKLVQEDWGYHWYRQNGKWRYRYENRDLPIADGEIRLKASSPADWNHMVGSGRFRISLYDGDTVIASRRFWSGWGRSAGNSEAPDTLEVNTENASVQKGDLVNLTVRSPYAGQGELVIATDKVHLVRPISLTEGTSEVSFTFDPDWGDSVYALMTVYTPRDKTDRPVPRRATGVSYIALDRTDQTLALEIDVPEVIRPRKKHVFKVKVEGAEAKKRVLVNFAAVDEGILQITKYTSPDAAKHFFGKKALGISFRDDYGRILNPNLGQPVDVNVGGDSLGGEGLTVVPTKTVAMFKGYVPVRNGMARIELDIPDFNGELRLMATAWNKRAVGSVSAPVKVRDKVPTVVGMPRFLAPGDSAAMTLSLDNVEGRAGDYQANITAGGVLSASADPLFKLKKGERDQQRVDIKAGTTGIEDVILKITGPGNYAAKSIYPIQVRSAFYPVTDSKLIEMAPGESLTLTSDWVEKYVQEDTDVTVSFSKLPGIDPAPIIKSLVAYPYGCTEQTVSVALPLLYAEDFGGIPGQTDLSRKRAIQNSIYRLSNRVSKDGSFGLWRSGDRYAHSWVGVYATDFMFRAKKEGFYVPEDMLERVVRASKTMSTMPRNSSLRYFVERRGSSWDISRRAESAAYAHYVLAQNGEGNLSKVRYHFENHRNKMRTPLSHAYLGGALKLLGDDRRSEEAFDKAISIKDYKDQKNYYYSVRRDLAGIVAVASEVGNFDLANSQVIKLSEKLRQRRWLNTQEKGYLVLAFRSLMVNSDAPKVSAENVSLTNIKKNPAANLIATDLSKDPVFTNRSKRSIWANVSITGSPKEAPPAVSNKIFVEKALFTKNGSRISGGVYQGEEIVVRIRYRTDDQISRSIVIADLLPAGFEIETVLNPFDGRQEKGRSQGPYAWLGTLSRHQIAEKRDDRFVASRNLYSSDKWATSAYVMRAVTPGQFTLPGVVVEDMYRPEEYGLSDAGKITIESDPGL